MLTSSGQAHSRGAHLAWGAGPHACPAKSPAQVIAVTAIELILNALPDLVLSVPAQKLEWRPGPFHRALATLPVQFSPTPATRMASAYGSSTAPRPAAVQQPAPAARVPAPAAQKPAKKGFWSSFLEIFRV